MKGARWTLTDKKKRKENEIYTVTKGETTLKQQGRKED